MEDIDDYVYDIEVPPDDEEDDGVSLDPGTPKSPKKVVGFLLPALITPGRIRRNEGGRKISEERDGIVADSNHERDCFQRVVTPLAKAHLGPRHTKTTTTAVEKISRREAHSGVSTGEEDCDASILKYNNAVQDEINLKTTDWIQVTVRDFKTGKEVMCKLIAPETNIQNIRQELHFIGGLTQSPKNSSSFIRLADEHTTWKKISNGGRGNCKKYHTVKQGGTKLNSKSGDGVWGLRTAHGKHTHHESDERSEWLPAIADETTLTEAYLNTRPPKDIGSLSVKHYAGAGESKSLRVKHAASEVSAAENNVNMILGMRQRPRYSAVTKMKPGSAAENLKSNQGEPTRTIGQGVQTGAGTTQQQRRKLLLLWEYTNADDDYRNLLLFAQRADEQKKNLSTATTTNSDSSLLKTKERPMEPFCDPPPMEPMEPGSTPPAILEMEPMEPGSPPPAILDRYVGARRNPLPLPARLKGNVDEDTASFQKGGGGEGGSGPTISSSDAKPVMDLKGMATWRPSDAHALVMAKLSNEEESSRRVLLAEDMRQWEGLSLMDGRVTRLNLSGHSPSLQGSAVIGPEIGRMSELERINFNNNKISGPLPLLECLGTLSFLRQLSLSNNQISGSLKNISVLKHLVDLDLSRNAITGSIPEELGSLGDLVSLNLSRNKLTGAMPPEMSGLSNLRVLNLSNNDLCGHFENWVGSMRHLQCIKLGHNQLEGSLPRSLTRLLSLEYLHVQDNQLGGDFPMEVLTNLNPGIREVLLQYNIFHASEGPDLGTHKEKKEKKTPALIEEDEETDDTSQVAAKAATVLVDIKNTLQDTYGHCSVAI